MRPLLSDILPELASAVGFALRGDGHNAQASEIDVARLHRWTYADSIDAGYIYLVQEDPQARVEIPAARTLTFDEDSRFHVDLRASGRLYGIEVLHYREAFLLLQRASWPRWLGGAIKPQWLR